MQFNNQGYEIFDVSFWQRIVQQNPPLVLEIDFQKMASYGTKAVICKAGQHTYADPGFAYNWVASKAAGLRRGTYWFMDSDSTPRSQAQKHWSLIKNDIGEGVHACDFEFGSHRTLDSVYVFINELQQLSGLPNHKLPIYTTYYYWIESYQNANLDWFGQYPLWLAWYNTTPGIVRVPYPWSEIPEQPFLWQWGTPPKGLEVGVRSREVDSNFLNGGEEKLNYYFGTASPIPDDGEDMDYYKVKSTNSTEYRIIRSGPRVTFPSVGQMPPGSSSMAKGYVTDLFTYANDSYDGTVLKAKAGDQWVHIYELNGAPKDGWMAVKHLGVNYTTLELVQVTPVPSEDYILHVKDGVTRRFDLVQ